VRTIIIAEAGVNHNGNIETAKKLIKKAAEAGVDFVKFQTFKADSLVSKKAKKAKYQLSAENSDEKDQYTMLKKLEIPLEWYPILINCCKKNGIKFLSTGFDEKSIDYLNSLNMSYIKIPSGEITNLPYLIHVAKKQKKIIISTGMCHEYEIKKALDVLIQYGISREMISVLHCNTEYPTPMKDVNLKAMLAIKNNLDVEVGYSDHTLGIEVPIAAVALGAKIIEKHFTLDRNLAGPDHSASLEPEELKVMVEGIRNIELATSGSGIKEPSESEIKNRTIVRKSIHLNRSLSKGHIICEEDIIALRPGDGISPIEWNTILGKKLKKEKKQFDKLSYSDFK
tara:strand:+ start:12961 stop:13980 length:1020 start_codon:yes stop_codon:yes gene_type:complete